MSFEAAARTLAMVQMTCPSVWKLVGDRHFMSYEEKFVATSDVAKEVDDMYGYKVRIAIEKLINTGDCGLGSYELNVRASDMVRKALSEYGIEFCPWSIAESHQIPKLVAESDVVAIEKGYNSYSAVIVVKNYKTLYRMGILNKKVDRLFRILFFPNRTACKMHLSDVANACVAKRATLIEDSEGRKFIAIDDPKINICDVKRMFTAEWSAPWIEAVISGKSSYAQLMDKKCGYYRVFKRVAVAAADELVRNGRSYTSAKKAIRGIKVGEKDIETPEVLRRLINYIKSYSVKGK